jgi:hypothetical protein
LSRVKIFLTYFSDFRIPAAARITPKKAWLWIGDSEAERLKPFVWGVETGRKMARPFLAKLGKTFEV